ncbi:CRISPR-associated protein Cmr4 [Tepidamorphus gemmatus]|uniref:CRISPR-associated protein Cmr4 n=1 Tax=Tepidamorphus gemmatus TaxID=747076 RepID=A0A4R3MBM2_9HYPH|nr:type III-B CRISPR module RAMP protein Cmr4 [Tepidamorphus gemmatus]TCT10532.1 CRISPR-associated protein Cmr4 [Tepidamorphus gemmatus]
MAESFKPYIVTAQAVDPIHVGTGGARLGRVDLSIVRDPVTRVPKIPGSSLAGVSRASAAMAKGKYPTCAGQGQPGRDGNKGHCGQPDCPICMVFGFARGEGGGFAGLAAFSDAQVFLFPVATREGPLWITSPEALRFIGVDLGNGCDETALYRENDGAQLNLGWLLLPVKTLDRWDKVRNALTAGNVPRFVEGKVGVVSDKLFTHIVNSNLEVRTSVSIDPETGAAEEGALFTYEALPRATILAWNVTCRNPAHFKVKESKESSVSAVDSCEKVMDVVCAAHPYLEHLGIGGMGTRGMGRLRVLHVQERSSREGETGAVPAARVNAGVANA